MSAPLPESNDLLIGHQASPNGPSSSPRPGLPPSGLPNRDGHPFSRPRSGGSRRWLFLAGGLLLAGAIVGTVVMINDGGATARADILTHQVKLENLDLTVVERGTLESTENKDVVCRVKSGAKGSTFATTIKWVIDDGTLVRSGQPIVILDSSALEEQHLAQKILVEQARAAKIAAEEQYKITDITNEGNEATAEIAIQLAELDLEKYVGLPKGTLFRMKPEEAKKMIGEMEKSVDAFLKAHGARLGAINGEYQVAVDDLSGKVELARADVENWRDRLSYQERMEQKGYVSPSQVQADQSRLNSANEILKTHEANRNLLRIFTAQRTVKDLASKVQEAWRALERVKTQSRATEIQARADRDTKSNIFHQEEDKLREIEKQIQECKVVAPQDGMVVYYVEPSRWSSSQQSIIAQGEPVREGQKLMRIPDLRRMQVSTRVHEAMVSRVHGDDRRSTGLTESVRTSMLFNTDGLGRLFGQHDLVQEEVRDRFRDKEYYLASQGQKSLVRVDAFADRVLNGHVKNVATVASQQDWMASDVKVYQTIVAIDESLDGLKPGMSAEVTILVEDTGEQVAAVPVQAVVGGAESGRTRKVWVMDGETPRERDVVIGLSNDKMAEVKEGLKVGDRVVINPKVLLGDQIKTHEPGEGKAAPKGRWGGEGGKGAGGKGSYGAKKAGPAMKGGAPGATKGGPPAQGGAPEGGQ